MHRNLNIQAQGEWLNSTQAMASKGWSDLSDKMGVPASDFGSSGQLSWHQGQTWSQISWKLGCLERQPSCRDSTCRVKGQNRFQQAWTLHGWFFKISASRGCRNLDVRTPKVKEPDRPTQGNCIWMMLHMSKTRLSCIHIYLRMPSAIEKNLYIWLTTMNIFIFYLTLWREYIILSGGDNNNNLFIAHAICQTLL